MEPDELEELSSQEEIELVSDRRDSSCAEWSWTCDLVQDTIARVVDWICWKSRSSIIWRELYDSGGGFEESV